MLIEKRDLKIQNKRIFDTKTLISKECTAFYGIRLALRLNIWDSILFKGLNPVYR